MMRFRNTPSPAAPRARERDGDGTCARFSRLCPILLLLPLLALGACKSTPEFIAPRASLAPYGTQDGEPLWAVVPPRNDSGTSIADSNTLGDKLVAAAAETRGLRVLPLNRTLEAMRALQMPAVRTPADARRLAETLGVDGILVSSITAYEPYTPTMGIMLALYARPGAMLAPDEDLDPRELSMRPTDPAARPNSNFREVPVSVTSVHLDGKDHQVLMDVRGFATGRSDPASALNWRRYTASMPLYEEFAAHFAVDQLMQKEWIRLGRAAAAGQAQRDPLD